MKLYRTQRIIIFVERESPGKILFIEDKEIIVEISRTPSKEYDEAFVWTILTAKGVIRTLRPARASPVALEFSDLFKKL